MKYIKYEIKDRVAYITLNRPEKRNALNQQLVEEFKSLLDLLENDNNAELLILRGEGDAFCAGADLKYLQKLQANSYEENLIDSQNLMHLYKRIYTYRKIVIAEVTGHAIAGGAGLATVCDIVCAVPEAKFGYTEVKIGFVPAIVSIFILRKIGETKTKELLLTGKLITADQALDLGLINHVFSKGQIRQEVEKIAHQLINHASGHSLELTKDLINQVQNMPLDEALEFAAKMNAKSRDHQDCKKGIAAFLNKEKILW